MILMWIIVAVLTAVAITAIAVYFTIIKKPKNKIPKPPSKRANVLIGYAQPWITHWPHLLKTGQHINLANTLLATGCTMTLMECDTAPMDDVVEYAKTFLERDIKVEIVIVNANSPDCLMKNDDWFIDRFEEIKKRVGTRNVLLQPVCEPGNKGGDKAKLQRWMKYAYDHWDCETAVINIGFEWSTPFLARAHYHEKHWCYMFDQNNGLKGQRYISTTDCGPMIDLSQEKTYLLAKTCIKNNSHFISYHGSRDWQNPLAIDWGKIEALRRAISES